MLKIVVGSRMPRPSGFNNGASGCSERTTKPNTNSEKLKYNHRERVLLPILRSGVEQVLEKAQPVRRSIFAVHQPGEVGAERNRRHDRRGQQQHGKQPDHEIHRVQSFFRSGAEKGAIETFPPCPARQVPPRRLDVTRGAKLQAIIWRVRYKETQGRERPVERGALRRRLIVPRRARFLVHNQRIVVDIDGCDELSLEPGRVPSRTVRAH